MVKIELETIQIFLLANNDYDIIKDKVRIGNEIEYDVS